MITAIIVTYNRSSYLKKTLEKTFAEEVAHVVVIDNASTDNTPEILKGFQEPRLITYRTETNAGGAGGFALGLKIALEKCSTEWFVLYDDDAYPDQGAFHAFLDLDKTGIQGIAAAVFSPSGEIQEMNRPSLHPFKSFKVFCKTVIGVLQGTSRDSFHISHASYYEEKLKKIDASSFVGFFIRRESVEKIGLPRKELFIYGDDLLYSLSLSQAGGNLFFAPGVKFIHHCQTLSAADQAQKAYKPLWKAYYTYRNGIEIYRQFSGLFFPVVVCLKALSWFRSGRNYGDRNAYNALVLAALKDGLAKDFSKSHASIVAKYSGKEYKK